MIRHLLSLLVIGSLIVPNVFAQTATDGAKNIRDAVKDKVAEELANIKKAVAKRSFVGTVTDKATLSFTLTNVKDQARTVNVNTETTIKLPGSKDGALEDIKKNDFVIAMGDVDSQNVMTAKRVLVISKPAVDKRKVLFGTVTETGVGKFTLENVKKETWTIKFTSDTKKPKTVSKDDKVIVVGTTSSTENTLTAKVVKAI